MTTKELFMHDVTVVSGPRKGQAGHISAHSPLTNEVLFVHAYETSWQPPDIFKIVSREEMYDPA